jgi:DNA-binding SARP family transcriptional activator
MRFGVLGQLVVHDEERAIQLSGRKQRGVLGVLLSRANSAVSPDHLIDALWGEQAPTSAQATLRWHVHQLRRALGDPDRIARVQHGYVLVVHPGELDADEFEGLLADGRRCLEESDLERASALLRQALKLWRGAAYADLTEHLDSPAVRDEAVRLEELRLEGYRVQIEADLGLGRHSAVIGQLRGLVAEHPFREEFRAQLMLALYRAGRQAEALEVYQQGRRVLVEDLGIEPGSELRRLEQAILSADPELDATPAGPASTPATAESTPAVPAQLPIDPPGFTGRTYDLARLRQLLDAPGAVVVICGPSGIGKSALAVHLAHQLAEKFPDGQLYVNVHGSTPGMEPLGAHDVLGGFLYTLGAGTPDAVDGNVDTSAAQFRSLVAGKRMLIVIDDAASAAQVWPLLPGSPSCAVILTSRRVLAGGMVHHRLSALPEAEAADLLRRQIGDRRPPSEAAALAEIARLCDRMPLALCVAAARLVARPGLLAERFAARLRDQRRRLDELVDSDRAVRASFAVSYQDLRRTVDGDAAARLFRLAGLLDVPDLGVEVAAALVDAPRERAELLLDALVDAQLMENEVPDRYRLHDLLRLFARERALEEDSESDRTAALRRVFHAYLAWLRQASAVVEPTWAWLYDCEPRALVRTGAELNDIAEVHAWFQAESDNLFAVVKQASDYAPDGPAVAVALCAAALSPMASAARGYRQRTLSTTAESVAPRTGDPNHVAISAYISGLVLHMDQPELAVAKLRSAREVWHELGNLRGEAAALRHLGTTCGLLRRHEEAFSYILWSLQLSQAAGDAHAEASCLGHLGLAYQRIGRKEEALDAHRRSKELSRELGNALSETIAAGNLATALHVFGEFDEAMTAYEEALKLAGEISERQVEAECLWGLAEIFRVSGQITRAKDLLTQATDILCDNGWITRDQQRAILTAPVPQPPPGFWTNI